MSSKHYEQINNGHESKSAPNNSVQDSTVKEKVLETPISSFEDNIQQQPVLTQNDNTQQTQQEKASTVQKSPRPKPPMSSTITNSPKPIAQKLPFLEQAVLIRRNHQIKK